VKIKLIFQDWQNQKFESIYSTTEGVQLSMGDFHSGTTFDGEIKLNKEQEIELKQYMQQGYRPVFWTMDGGSD